jgi:hypothetical protein
MGEVVAKALPPVEADESLRQPRQLEEEDVPGLARLAGRSQPLQHATGMGDVEDRQPLYHFRMADRGRPGNRCAPVVTDEHRAFGAPFGDQLTDVSGEAVHGVRIHPAGP